MTSALTITVTFTPEWIEDKFYIRERSNVSFGRSTLWGPMDPALKDAFIEECYRSWKRIVDTTAARVLSTHKGTTQ